MNWKRQQQEKLIKIPECARRYRLGRSEKKRSKQMPLMRSLLWYQPGESVMCAAAYLCVNRKHQSVLFVRTDCLQHQMTQTLNRRLFERIGTDDKHKQNAKRSIMSSICFHLLKSFSVEIRMWKKYRKMIINSIVIRTIMMVWCNYA